MSLGYFLVMSRGLWFIFCFTYACHIDMLLGHYRLSSYNFRFNPGIDTPINLLIKLIEPVHTILEFFCFIEAMVRGGVFDGEYLSFSYISTLSYCHQYGRLIEDQAEDSGSCLRDLCCVLA